MVGTESEILIGCLLYLVHSNNLVVAAAQLRNRGRYPLLGGSGIGTAVNEVSLWGQEGRGGEDGTCGV